MTPRCSPVDWRERALAVEEAARRYLAAFDRWSDGIGQYLPGEDVTAYVKRRDAERVAANDARRALAALLPPR